MASSSGDGSSPIGILFVCLGNICRSPMAHAVFESMVGGGQGSNSLFKVDSAGTGAYHEGDAPDRRTLRTLERHGIHGFEHAARKIRTRDFVDFDYVMAMDSDNLEDLEFVRSKAEKEFGDASGGGAANMVKKAPGELAKLAMFGDYNGSRRKGEEIGDPYYGGGEGFEKAYEQCERFSRVFLEKKLGERWERIVAEGRN